MTSLVIIGLISLIRRIPSLLLLLGVTVLVIIGLMDYDLLVTVTGKVIAGVAILAIFVCIAKVVFSSGSSKKGRR